MPEIEFLDWDSTIENDSEFTLLDEGDYNYQVTNLEKRYTNKGAPMAVLTLRVFNDTSQTVVTDYLTLQRNTEWKLSQFFRSIGQKKHGEPLKMDWSKVVGSEGRCKVKVDTYTREDNSEGKSNKIDRYYDPKPNTTTTSPGVPW